MLDAVAADVTDPGAVGVSCNCLPCRFGNAADQPRRFAVYPTDQTVKGQFDLPGGGQQSSPLVDGRSPQTVSGSPQ
ncbi:hypothetical protein GCM10009838_20550 [Catenulispora subtropica]|uniref:Uncharacterized protein n=1 Tax=Catenulispora subtropica TaxID=450798 RepID=A0ABN2R4I1_9ACTN